MEDIIADDETIPHFENCLKVHFNRSKDPIWIFDGIRRCFLYGNPAAIQAFGNENESAFLATDFSDTSAKTREWTERLIRNELRYHKTRLMPWTFYSNSKDGKPFQETVRLSAIYVESRLCMLVEVVQLKKDENDDEIAVNDFRILGYDAWKYSPTMISMFEVNGSRIMHNLKALTYYQQLEETLGSQLHFKDPLSKSVNTLKSIFLDDSIFDSILATLGHGMAYVSSETKVRSGHGVFKAEVCYHNVSVSLQKNSITGGDVLIVHQTDVTKMVLKKLKMERLRFASQQNARLIEVVGQQFTASLNGIIGFSASLESDPGLTGPKAIQRISNIIRTSALTLQQQIKNVCCYSKLLDEKIALQPKLMKLHDVVHSVIQSASTRLSDKIQIVNKVNKTFPAIVADGTLVLPALQVLVDNGIKYTKEGVVTISARKEGGSVYIQVKDTGQGIAPCDQARIFQLCETASASTNSSGIGLCLIKEIAKLHNGTVTVTSELHKGTTFELSLSCDLKRNAKVLTQPQLLENESWKLRSINVLEKVKSSEKVSTLSVNIENSDEYKQLNKTYEKLSTDHASLSLENQNIVQQCAQLTANNTELARQHADLIARYNTISTELQTLTVKSNQAFQASNSSSQQNCKNPREISKQLSIAIAEIRALRRQKSTLLQRIEELSVIGIFEL